MPKLGSNKTKLTLWIDKNIIAEAKEMGLNLSAFLELKLREYLALVKNRTTEELADPPGFEPGIYGLEGRRSIHAEPRAR